MTPAARQWIEQAEYDLETANAMFAACRYTYVLFCCQQAVEKSVKAIIVERTNELPPRIHSLPRLVELGNIIANADQALFLAELSAYYIQTRYPEEIKSLTAAVNRSIAEEVLGKTKELTTWLLSTLK